MTTSISGVVSKEFILPLEPGDHLSRDEYERRYNAMPHVNKAELIEGMVYMPSPVRVDRHGIPHFDFIGWLSVYRFATRGVNGADNSTIRMDLESMPQPDIVLFVHPSFGGQAKISEDGFLERAPELAIEISSSSASFDLHTKKDLYFRNKVQEYLVWRYVDQKVDWFCLREDDYECLQPGKDGILRSEVFPGLWLDVDALLTGDFDRVLEVQRSGLASAEHQRFVESLRRWQM